MMSRAGENKPAGKRWALAGLAVLSLLQYRVTILIHGSHFGQLVDATRGVTTGEPHWRGYQNRVLGPYAAEFLDSISGLGLEIIVLLAMMSLPMVQNLVFFLLTRRLTGDTSVAFSYTVFFAAAFLGLQDANWLYLWDYLDLIVFTVFLYGVLARRSTLWFVAVFVVGVLNRESALLIGVWMFLDAVVVETKEGAIRPGLRSPRRALTGASLVVVGTLVVEGLRRLLFESAAGASAGVEQIPLGPLGMTRLNHNLSTLVDSIFAPTLLMPLAVTAALIVVPIWVLTRLRDCDRNLLPIALTFLVAWAGNLVFGLVDESRVHLWLVPFPLFLHLGLMHMLTTAEAGDSPAGDPAAGAPRPSSSTT